MKYWYYILFITTITVAIIFSTGPWQWEKSTFSFVFILLSVHSMIIRRNHLVLEQKIEDLEEGLKECKRRKGDPLVIRGEGGDDR